jgi:hypothetical protein
MIMLRYSKTGRLGLGARAMVRLLSAFVYSGGNDHNIRTYPLTLTHLDEFSGF